MTLLPMIILIFCIGIYPDAFLGFLHESVHHLIERVNTGSINGPNIAKNIIEVLK
jgi:NADH-quinone oxidoreductase subunit M